jgi:hypothetical protein
VQDGKYLVIAGKLKKYGEYKGYDFYARGFMANGAVRHLYTELYLGWAIGWTVMGDETKLVVCKDESEMRVAYLAAVL